MKSIEKLLNGKITGLKGDKFEEGTKWLGGAIKRKSKKKIVPYKVGGAREHLLLSLLYYQTYVSHAFFSKFVSDGITLNKACRVAFEADIKD